MPIVVNSNQAATLASNYLDSSHHALSKSINRMSTGKRINSPSDDAGGLAVSSKLNSQITRNRAITQNLNNSISFLQVQHGALKIAGRVLDRMAELKMLSLDSTKNAQDMENYDKEFVELNRQIAQMSRDKFNGVSLFTSSHKADHALQSVAHKDSEYTSIVSLARNFISGQFIGTSGKVLGEISPEKSQSQLINQRIDIDGKDSDVWHKVSLSAGDYTIEAIPRSAGGLYDAYSVWGTPPADKGDGYETKFEVSISAGNYIVHDTPVFPQDMAQTIANITPLSINLNQDTIISIRLGDTNPSDNRGGLSLNISSASNNSTNSGEHISLADFTTTDFNRFTQNLSSALAINGAEQQRISKEIENRTTNMIGTEESVGRIEDLDFALESTRLAKHKIVNQSSASMLAQANQMTYLSLQLMGL